MIYNWKPEYTGRHESGEEEQDFQQTYVFGPADGYWQQQEHSSRGQGTPAAAAAVNRLRGVLRKWGMSWA